MHSYSTPNSGISARFEFPRKLSMNTYNELSFYTHGMHVAYVPSQVST